MKKLGRIATLGMAGALAFALAGCSGGIPQQAQQPATSSTDSEVATYADIEAMNFEYSEQSKDASYDESSATKIVLEDDEARIEGAGAESEGSDVSITSEGTYIVSGQLANDQLCIDVGNESLAHIVLAGASINNDTGAAVFVKSAEDCIITLAEGTENTLTDGSTYDFEGDDDEPNATLFSKDDLSINGSGILNVNGTYKHAIYSKDDLVITGGTYNVTSKDDAIRGKDSVRILDGDFNIESGEDAVKSSRDDDPALGYVSIDGGRFAISAGDDALHGETYLRVTSGTIDVVECAEGIEAMVVSIDGGDISVKSSDDALNASAPSSSSGNAASEGPGGKGGMEAGNTSCQLYINGGNVNLVAEGDAIDSNGMFEINGGTVHVTGPSGSDNGSLDFDISGECNGGTIIIAGSNGMEQSFSGGSQPFATVQARGNAGQEIIISDENGAVLASYAPAADFDTVIVSCPQFVEGATYSVTVGDSVTSVTASTTPSGFAGGRGEFGQGGPERPDAPDGSSSEPGSRPGGKNGGKDQWGSGQNGNPAGKGIAE